MSDLFTGYESINRSDTFSPQEENRRDETSDGAFQQESSSGLEIRVWVVQPSRAAATDAEGARRASEATPFRPWRPSNAGVFRPHSRHHIPKT